MTLRITGLDLYNGMASNAMQSWSRQILRVATQLHVWAFFTSTVLTALTQKNLQTRMQHRHIRVFLSRYVSRIPMFYR